MNRLHEKVAIAFGGVLAAFALAGCGGKPKEGDFEPPPVAANTPAPAPVTSIPDPPAPKKEDPTPKPKDTSSKDPIPGTGLPPVPPPFPLPKNPVTKDPPKNPTPFVPPPVPEKPPEKKDPDKKFEWPTSINARPMSEWIKDINDSDPAIREQGLRTVPAFGPAARTAATKMVILHMNAITERDPGVRAAAFEAIGSFAALSPDGTLETQADTTEAIRLLVLTLEAPGSAGSGARLHAVNTLGSFGPRAATAIPALVGLNMTKPEFERAYETRRAIASTLGSISFIKDTGPSPRSLHCLTDVLIHDPSAAVRLAAYQSVVLLGPPYLPPPKGQPEGAKPPAMVVDQKAVDGYAKSIKSRLAPFKAEVGSKERESATGLMERDRQVEIFARLALMRLDLKEINDENLTGISKYVTQPGDSGPKLQALQALALMNEFGSKRINDVCKALEDEDPQVATSAAYTLVAMGKEAKPAIEFLEKMKKRGSKKGDKDAKDLPNEYYADLATRAIKAISEAKPANPKP